MQRVGFGFDVHRLVPGRRLVLCGVEFAHPVGLLGHSDADAPTHALMDALLGAAALGDIGGMFPDSDDAFLGADSLVLLRQVVDRLRENGWAVGNIDATIIAQAPKMAPHIPAMREHLADARNADPGPVNVQATPDEPLGFTGRKEGVSAHAVALIEPIV